MIALMSKLQDPKQLNIDTAVVTLMNPSSEHDRVEGLANVHNVIHPLKPAPT